MGNRAPRFWLLTLAGVIVGLGVCEGRAEAGFLYAVDGQNGNPATKLYTIDPTTLATATVGPVNFAVTGLAFDPLTFVVLERL